MKALKFRRALISPECQQRGKHLQSGLKSGFWVSSGFYVEYGTEMRALGWRMEEKAGTTKALHLVWGGHLYEIRSRLLLET